MTTRIQMRRSTAAVATSDNAVLAAGEWGFETDTHKLKIGDGVTAWVSLPYSVVPNPTGTFVAQTEVAELLEVTRQNDGHLHLDQDPLDGGHQWGISWDTEGVSGWTTGVDQAGEDFNILNDPAVGDVLRAKHGAFFQLASTCGSPDNTKRLEIADNTPDAAGTLRKLLVLNTSKNGGLGILTTVFIDCVNWGVSKFSVDVDGNVTIAGDLTINGAINNQWTAWTAVSFTNSWSNFGAPFNNMSYRKSKDGTMLGLSGVIVGGGNGTSAFTLPAGFRPTTRKDFAAYDGASGSLVGVNVNTDGTVVLSGAARTQVNLNSQVPLNL